jgi:hypothetical protein
MWDTAVEGALRLEDANLVACGEFYNNNSPKITIRPHDEIEAVLSVIRIRNAIVHEAYRPTEIEAQMIRPVMQTIRLILGLDELKSPALTTLNSLLPPP